ncbi:MAG: flagellar biosynthesis protein FlhA [Treponema sp.]|nr:flagellar biosynthesis protein FlhA [Treponema sp.]
MANEKRGNVLTFIQQNAVAVAALVGVFLVILPMPQLLIDFCMILNIAISVIILLVVVSTPRASDFETFPRVVLFATIFSVAINISSTRLILSGTMGAGHRLANQSFMVQAFANIIAGSDIVIGFIVFVILIIFQILVVTKGASRVSEVAARFSLDSMNQKLFDIDNRLNSGALNPDEAEIEKAKVRREIDFYSAMDGSSKFVSGNVKFGVVVTLVNLIGGLVIGVIRNSMGFGEAVSTYSILTIGDGLTSQIPSLIISFATGVLVTGTKSDEPFDQKLIKNFSRDGQIYQLVGVGLVLSGFALRNNTQVLLIPIGILFFWVGLTISRQKEKAAIAAKEQAENAKKNEQANPIDDSKTLEMLDPLSLEIGYALIPLVNKEKGAELLERITRIRTEARLDMGFNIPKIRIQDNMTLDPNDYSFKIQGIEAGHANIRLGYLMCMDTGAVIQKIEGEHTKDPAFGMDAIWLPDDRRQEAENAGYVVVDPPTIISTHITEIIRSHAAEMLDRQAVSNIIEKVKEKNPVLINEVLDVAKLSYGMIEKVLQNLLEEKVSIRNYVKILETMANYASVCKSSWELTEKVREALGLQICMQYADPADKKLRMMRLSEPLTQLIAAKAYLPPDGSKPYPALDPVDRRKWISAVSGSLSKINNMGMLPIILCVQDVRQLVRASIEREQPGVVVLSDREVYAAGKNIVPEIIEEIRSEDETA